MSAVLTNRQRNILYQKNGRPTLALEFDVFPDGEVSMWAHVRHDVPFVEMKAAFEAIKRHLESFIADGEMCPFNPAFVQQGDAMESERQEEICAPGPS